VCRLAWERKSRLPTTKAIITQHLRRNSYAPKLDDIEFREICENVDALTTLELDVAEKAAASYTQDVHGEWSGTDARAQRYMSTIGSFVALGVSILAAGALGASSSSATISRPPTAGALVALIFFGASALCFIAASLTALWALRSTPTPVDLPLSVLKRDSAFGSLRAQWIARTICRTQETWLLNEHRTVLVRRAGWAYLGGFLLIAIGTAVFVIERLI